MEEQVVGSTSSASNMHEVGNENSNPFRNMVMDAMRMSEGNVRECPIVEEEPNADAARFFDLLKDSDEPLWDGCMNHSKLSIVAHVFTIKSDHGLSEAVMTRLLNGREAFYLSVFHRGLKKIYGIVPQAPTESPTNITDDITDGLPTSRSARMSDACLSAHVLTDRKVWRDF
jgi:hypothetical protein